MIRRCCECRHFIWPWQAFGRRITAAGPRYWHRGCVVWVRPRSAGAYRQISRVGLSTVDWNG